MWNRESKQDDLTPLSALVEEEFAGTVGELVDRFAEEGVAIDVDRSGRLCVATAVADRMRQERAEAERRAAEEAAERARVAAERAAETEAKNREARERQRRREERIRRIEVAAGANIIELERQMRREIIRQPDTGMSFDDRQALEDRAFTLDEIEQWVLQRYGVETLEGITA